MKYLSFLIVFLLSTSLYSIDISNGTLSGNFESYSQYNFTDSIIGAERTEEIFLSNSYFYMTYNTSDVTVGMRFEAYKNELVGYDPRYRGHGIAHRFATYKSDLLDITVGHFYEQFGSGMILRAYEERLLGIDNAFDGVRFKFRPYKGITLTGLAGNQRDFWENGDGLVRAADLDLDLNSMLGFNSRLQYNLGSSVVSRFQRSLSTSPILPENVFAYSLRGGLIGSNFSVDAEYLYKYNDPNATNQQSFNPGQGLIINASYFQKGFSFIINAHKVDNADMRSNRSSVGQELMLNFIAPLTRQQTYALATIFPFATQLNGEMGIQADLTYKLPRNSLLGGKYGTTLNFNYSQVNSIDSTAIFTEVDDRLITYSYDSDFISPIIGDRVYFREFNFEVNRRFSKNFKSRFTLIRSQYDRNQIEGGVKYGMVNSTIAILEGTQKLGKGKALRFEAQHMWADMDSIPDFQDNQNGNWAMLLLEYTLPSGFYFTVFNMYNYDNQEKIYDDVDPSKYRIRDFSLNYLNANIAYIYDATRFSIGYGRFRGGLLCVGGICRPVPAFSGFNFSISSSF